MFKSSVNRPCSRMTLMDAMYKSITKANQKTTVLKKLKFYSLRHHYASILIYKMNEGKL